MRFIVENKVFIISILMTIIVTATLSLGSYKIIIDKKIANQQIDDMEKELKNIKEKQKESLLEDVKNESKITTLTDESKESIENISPVAKTPNVTVSPPQKVEIEEKFVSCVLFDGTVSEVTKSECEIIKQKNVIVTKILDKYDNCIEKSDDTYQDKMQQGYEPRYTEEYNDDVQECVDKRDKKLKKLL